MIGSVEVNLIDVILSGRKNSVFIYADDGHSAELLHLTLHNKINNNTANHGKPGKSDEDTHDDAMPHGRIGCLESADDLCRRRCGLFLFFLHHRCP